MTAVVRSHWRVAEVVENLQWTERLFTLRLAVELLPFKAGQFVRLQLPLAVNGVTQSVARSYSLINPPQQQYAEIFYNTVPQGQLSQALSRLQPGECVELSQPAAGFFVLDELPRVPHLWMVATGTGIGPYLSMLRTAEVWERFARIVLVHGVPWTRELVYQDLLRQIAMQHPAQFRILGCVTRDACTQPHCLTGRVTSLLASGTLETTAGLSIQPDTTHVMLCGNHNMLNDMKALLAERGLQRHLRHKPGHITTEQYF